MNTLYFSPANFSNLNNEGAEGKAALRYRDQWNSISSPAYRTTEIEAEYRFYGSSIDSWHAGLYLVNDQSNNSILKQNSGSLLLAYSRKFGSYRHSFHQFTVGSGVSINRTNINTGDLWFSRQYDQTKFVVESNVSSGETNLTDNRGFASIDLGIKWQYRVMKDLNIYLGFSSHHINQPNNGFVDMQERLESRNMFSAQLSKKTGRTLTHFLDLYAISQQPSLQLIPGYGIQVDFPDNEDVAIKAALHSRVVRSLEGLSNDALIVTIGILSEEWGGSFTYEINTSKLNGTTRGNGALEIGLSYFIQKGY